MWLPCLATALSPEQAYIAALLWVLALDPFSSDWTPWRDQFHCLPGQGQLVEPVTTAQFKCSDPAISALADESVPGPPSAPALAPLVQQSCSCCSLTLIIKVQLVQTQIRACFSAQWSLSKHNTTGDTAKIQEHMGLGTVHATNVMIPYHCKKTGTDTLQLWHVL